MSAVASNDLVSRYKQNYGIPAGADVTEAMIRRHWELERQLTRELLESSGDNRREVFARCYDTLYRELDWLNRLIETSDAQPSAEWRRIWSDLIGAPPKKIFEIGAGRGELISHLAECGHDCTAAEITRERGEKFAAGKGAITWNLSDGVHLDRYAQPNTYDVVLSNSLLEHLHPDDIIDHFRGAFYVLKDGGRYIFCTPHKASGPSDISAVFGCDEPQGMHLREYSYRDLGGLLATAGFQKVSAVVLVPSKIGRVLKREFKPLVSRTYLVFFCGLERLMFMLPSQPLRRKAARLARIVLFKPCIFIEARKGD